MPAQYPPLRLRAIRVRAVVLTLKRPIVARIMTISQWPLILVDLETEEGITGHSYICPYNTSAIKYLVPVIEDFEALFKGTPVAPAQMFSAARKSLHLMGYSGVTLSAVSALDMAAWDALAKAAGLPLCVLLGGSIGTVKAYNSSGLWLDAPDRLADEALALRDQGGFAGIKLRLGRTRTADDIAAIERIRQAVGPDMQLMADFNQALDLAEALQRFPMVDDLRLAWIEEPILYENLAGCAQLASELETPIQLGENFYGPRDLQEALAMKACDLVMPDAMRIGGVTGWLRAASLAEVAGIPMSTHLYPEFSAHLMRVTPTAHWLEWQDWAEPILQRPFPVKDGMVHIPAAPGAGLEWNEDAVRAYAAAL
jgi:mandelate racemase